MTQILHSLHPDALIDGRVKLAGTPLAGVPHTYGLYDYRVGLPRTVVYDSNLFHENGGSFIDADGQYSASQTVAELGRQARGFGKQPFGGKAWLNCETYPQWANTDERTKKVASARFPDATRARSRMARDVEHDYEIAGLEWFQRVILALRHQGIKVGAYEPCPDWCEQTPGLCYHVASMLDFALVPLYVHKGYDKPNGPLYPTAWYANQWARRIARYRQNLPGVEIIGIGWPMLDLKGNPGTNRIALSESYRKVQALCAKNEGIDLVLWDDPKTQDQLKDAIDTLAVWRGML